MRSKNAVIAEYHGRTVHAYLWNLVELDPLVVAECGDRDLTTFRARTNYLYLAVAALSLGAWVPMTLEWRCAE